MIKYGKKRIIIFLAVVGLLVFLSKLGILNPLEKISNSFLSPVLRRFHSSGSVVRTSFNNQVEKQDVFEENKELKERVAKLTEENVELEITRQENDSLREHLSFLGKNQYRYVMSNVVSRGDITDISDKSEVFTIDKGQRDGILPGLAVVSSKGVIVGKVAEVKEAISLVYLTNNSKCKLAATVLNQEGTGGITEGDLGLTIKMGFIPQSKNIQKDDIVVTSGLEYLIPRGLALGRIIEVSKDNNELWQNAVIESMADNDNLVIVSVLLPYN